MTELAPCIEFFQSDLVIVHVEGWSPSLGIVLAAAEDQYIGTAYTVSLWDSCERCWGTLHVMKATQLTRIVNYRVIRRAVNDPKREGLDFAGED